MDEAFDPFALGGYAEEDDRVEEMRRELQCFPSSKSERQGNLFRFVLEAIDRKGKGGSDGNTAEL